LNLIGVCNSVSMWDAVFKKVLSLDDANLKTLLKWDADSKYFWEDQYSKTILKYLFQRV